MTSRQIQKALALNLMVLVLVSGNSSAASLAIDGVISQTVGTTAVIPLGTSGNATNTSTWIAGNGTVGTGVVGQFLVKDSTNNVYGMRVSATNPTGKLVSGTDSLMVARTVDSQGLTDNGTLSVYVRMTGNNTATDAPNDAGAWTLDLNFSFFNADFTAPASLGIQLTSLDIDFNQRYYTSNATFTSNFTYDPTNITPLSDVTGFSGFTASGNSEFNNAAHAVSSMGTGSSFDVRLAHDDVALFMFEFRDPSNIVPEPTSATLVAVAGMIALGFARRSRKAS